MQRPSARANKLGGPAGSGLLLHRGVATMQSGRSQRERTSAAGAAAICCAACAASAGSGCLLENTRSMAACARPLPVPIAMPAGVSGVWVAGVPECVKHIRNTSRG